MIYAPCSYRKKSYFLDNRRVCKQWLAFKFSFFLSPPGNFIQKFSWVNYCNTCVHPAHEYHTYFLLSVSQLQSLLCMPMFPWSLLVIHHNSNDSITVSLFPWHRLCPVCCFVSSSLEYFPYFPSSMKWWRLRILTFLDIKGGIISLGTL